IVDAASEYIERPSPWLVRGADLVIYSGGKFLRGPQTSGLLLGSKRLCQAAWRNGSPHQALGPPKEGSKGRHHRRRPRPRILVRRARYRRRAPEMVRRLRRDRGAAWAARWRPRRGRRPG